MIKVEVKSQIIDYVKKNWKELLIVALLFFFYIKGRMDYSSLYNLHIETTQSYEKRIEDLNKAHEERIRKKDEAIKQYIQRVEDLRNQYDTQKEEIEVKREEKQQEIKQILLEKPEVLINDIESKFGFKYVE